MKLRRQRMPSHQRPHLGLCTTLGSLYLWIEPSLYTLPKGPKSRHKNLFSEGKIFHREGEMAEMVLFLDSANWNSLTDGSKTYPSCLSGWDYHGSAGPLSSFECPGPWNPSEKVVWSARDYNWVALSLFPPDPCRCHSTLTTATCPCSILKCQNTFSSQQNTVWLK